MPRTKPTNVPDDVATHRLRRALESKTNYHSQSSSSPSQVTKTEPIDSDSNDEEIPESDADTVVLDSSSDDDKPSTAKISKKTTSPTKKINPAEAKTKTSRSQFNESQETCSYTDRHGVKKRRYRPGRFTI